MYNKWLESAISEFEIEEEDKEYLLSRGCSEENIDVMNIKTWKRVEPGSIGKDLIKLVGKDQGRINNSIIFPFYTPTLSMSGFESRYRDTKKVFDYRSECCKWTPAVFGMNKYLDRIINGSPLWIVEGVFDFFAFEWVLPKGDAVIATFRASVSKNLSRMLYRFGNSVNVIYDNDEAGKKGLEISLKTMRKFGVRCRSVSYSGFKDPGEVWDSGGVERVVDVFGGKTW